MNRGKKLAKCKSGNLMTCRGLIRLVAPSLLLSIHILHLFVPLLFTFMLAAQQTHTPIDSESNLFEAFFFGT